MVRSHKSLKELLKMDIAKNLKVAGYSEEAIAEFKKNKKKQAKSNPYSMLLEAFSDKDVRAKLKVFVPLGNNVDIGENHMSITLFFGNEEGQLAVENALKLTEILEGNKNDKKKKCSCKKGKCKKSCKKSKN